MSFTCKRMDSLMTQYESSVVSKQRRYAPQQVRELWVGIYTVKTSPHIHTLGIFSAYETAYAAVEKLRKDCTDLKYASIISEYVQRRPLNYCDTQDGYFSVCAYSSNDTPTLFGLAKDEAEARLFMKHIVRQHASSQWMLVQ